jgi:ribosomal protein L20
MTTKQPTEAQLVAAMKAYHEVSRKWEARDYLGWYIIQEALTYAFAPCDVSEETAYHYRSKKERDEKLRQLIVEAIVTAVVNA